MYSGMAKGNSWAEATLDSKKKIKPVALAIASFMSLKASVSQLRCFKFRSNLLESV